MRSILTVLALIAIFVTSCGDADKESAQMPEGFPDDVYVKFIQMHPLAEISNYDSREGNNGMLYEVTAEEDDETVIVLFTEEGAVLSERMIVPIEIDDMPEAVSAMTADEFPGSTLLSASKITVNESVEFHVVVETKDQGKYRVVSSSRGELMHQEAITTDE
jgi:hypothetical protein